MQKITGKELLVTALAVGLLAGCATARVVSIQPHRAA